jgi:hypothetical protein
MMISLFRKEPDGRLRYYNIHDQQLQLGREWAFTVSYTVGASSWRERLHYHDSPGEMDAAVRKLVKRKLREGYSFLYGFEGRGRGPGRDLAGELKTAARKAK